MFLIYINFHFPCTTGIHIVEPGPNRYLKISSHKRNDISDTRESPALDIIENFKSKGVEISFYDPFVDSLIVDNKEVNKETSQENFEEYDMLLMHTPHSEFSSINFSKINVPIFDATGSEFIDDAERI